MEEKRIAFLGCHLDDIEIGCGGLISRLLREKRKVTLMLATLSQSNQNACGEIVLKRNILEAYSAVEALGGDKSMIFVYNIAGQKFQYQTQDIREILLNIKKQFKPDHVFFPCLKDIHQDHRVLAEESVRIFRDCNCFGYEIVRSCHNIEPNLYVNIMPEDVRNKIDAIGCYKSQLKQSAGYYFNAAITESTLRYHGAKYGNEYAEAYEVYCIHY